MENSPSKVGELFIRDFPGRAYKSLMNLFEKLFEICRKWMEDKVCFALAAFRKYLL